MQYFFSLFQCWSLSYRDIYLPGLLDAVFLLYSSAGVDRTGTHICLDYLMQYFFSLFQCWSRSYRDIYLPGLLDAVFLFSIPVLELVVQGHISAWNT